MPPLSKLFVRAEDLASLDLPADPARVALGHEAFFLYHFLFNGLAIRWLKPEAALLIF